MAVLDIIGAITRKFTFRPNQLYAESLRRLNPNMYADTTMCALVLEDNPVVNDSRLDFESFPENWQESYAVNYKELGGQRAPQPLRVAYQDGNWGEFTLELVFRAGEGRVESGKTLTALDLDQILIEMERKVRWCQALTFPLERKLGNQASRMFTNAFRSGLLTQEDIQKAGGFHMTRNDPPMLLIVVGSWWVQRAYATSVAITWEGPYHPISARPYGARVSIGMKPVKAVYPTWHSIRNQAGLGGYESGAKGETVSPNPLITGAQGPSVGAEFGGNTLGGLFR